MAKLNLGNVDYEKAAGALWNGCAARTEPAGDRFRFPVRAARRVRPSV